MLSATLVELFLGGFIVRKILELPKYDTSSE
jgi:hypothetical protein